MKIIAFLCLFICSLLESTFTYCQDPTKIEVLKDSHLFMSPDLNSVSIRKFRTTKIVSILDYEKKFFKVADQGDTGYVWYQSVVDGNSILPFYSAYHATNDSKYEFNNYPGNGHKVQLTTVKNYFTTVTPNIHSAKVVVSSSDTVVTAVKYHQFFFSVLNNNDTVYIHYRHIDWNRTSEEFVFSKLSLPADFLQLLDVKSKPSDSKKLLLKALTVPGKGEFELEHEYNSRIKIDKPFHLIYDYAPLSIVYSTKDQEFIIESQIESKVKILNFNRKLLKTYKTKNGFGQSVQVKYYKEDTYAIELLNKNTIFSYNTGQLLRNVSTLPMRRDIAVKSKNFIQFRLFLTFNSWGDTDILEDYKEPTFQDPIEESSTYYIMKCTMVAAVLYNTKTKEVYDIYFFKTDGY